ncbi:hypothetical protein QP185_21985 [Sphingomonas aerolata]
MEAATLFTLRWFDDPVLRRTDTAELNKARGAADLARAGRLSVSPARSWRPRACRTSAKPGRLRSASSPLRSCCSTAGISAAPLEEVRRRGTPI